MFWENAVQLIVGIAWPAALGELIEKIEHPPILPGDFTPQ